MEKARQWKKQIREKLKLSENKYLLVFSLASGAISIVFLFLAIYNVLLYDVGIGLFTSLLTTAITVFFLDFFINNRREREWKNIKKNALLDISIEASGLFSQILRLVEGEFNEICFKTTIVETKIEETRKTLIYSKLKEFKERDPFKLAINQLDPFTSDVFNETETNLADIQIRYGTQINDARIIDALIQTRQALKAIKLSQAMNLSWNKIKSENPTLLNSAQKLIPEAKEVILSSNLLETTLPPLIKKLVDSIIELWNLGVQFDRVA